MKDSFLKHLLMAFVSFMFYPILAVFHATRENNKQSVANMIAMAAIYYIGALIIFSGALVWYKRSINPTLMDPILSLLFIAYTALGILYCRLKRKLDSECEQS